MFKKFYSAIISLVFTYWFFIHPAFAEPPLWEIYNTIYGNSYVSSNQDLEDTYGVDYDEVWVETNGYVEASARYAGYTQKFGYYTDISVGDNQVELMDVTTTGYLYECSDAGGQCIEDSDCPNYPSETCEPVYGVTFLTGGGTDVIGLYDDPSGSPTWFSESALNQDGSYDHMWTFRAPDFDPDEPEYFIAWEDLNLGDADYNDLVLIMKHLKPGCEEDNDCNDGVACTVDSCVSYLCQNDPDDSICPEDTLCADYYCDIELDCQVSYEPSTTECRESAGICDLAEYCSGSSADCPLDEFLPDTTLCRESTDEDCDPAEYCTGTSADCPPDEFEPDDTPCDDGDYCTVNDVCTNGDCIGSPKDCSHLDDQCNVGVCEPGNGECIKDPEPKNGEPCDDEDHCTENDICTDGVCAGTPIPGCPCQTKIYRGGICGEATPIEDTVYNRPGRRGLSITCCEEETFCICSSCDPEFVAFTWTVSILDGSDPDFMLDDLVASSGTGDTFTIKVKEPCTEHCPDEPVKLEVTVEDSFGNVDSVVVAIGRVALGLGDTFAHPNTQTTDIELLLWNYENHVKALNTRIYSTEKWACEAYDNEAACVDTYCNTTYTDETGCNGDANCKWAVVGGVEQCINKYNCEWTGEGCIAVDNLVCTECVVDEDRTPEFICTVNEQADGSCEVALYSTEPDDLIQQGDGAVARIKFDVLGKKTSKECIDLIPLDRDIADQFNEPLCAVPKTGQICFRICGDVYPQDCYECESCGDGIVDIFDILEEIDIILDLQNASFCQKMCGHGDVPLGMPPYCGDPAGVNPPNCNCDGEIDIFDALVIIDKALSKMNCCDYCMFGEIY